MIQMAMCARTAIEKNLFSVAGRISYRDTGAVKASNFILYFLQELSSAPPEGITPPDDCRGL